MRAYANSSLAFTSFAPLRRRSLVLPSLFPHPVETKAAPLGSSLAGGTPPFIACRCDWRTLLLSGGAGGSRTRVRTTFPLKGLQQFFPGTHAVRVTGDFKAAPGLTTARNGLSAFGGFARLRLTHLPLSGESPTIHQQGRRLTGHSFLRRLTVPRWSQLLPPLRLPAPADTA